MAAKKQDDRHAVAPVLRVAPLGELRVYAVTEEELDAIGRGSPGSIFLNFALALLPLSGAFLITLLSTTIDKLGALVFFIASCVICLLAGVICLVLAWHYHFSTSKIIDRIKNRMPPPPPIPQEGTADAQRPPTAPPPEAPPPGPSSEESKICRTLSRP